MKEANEIFDIIFQSKKFETIEILLSVEEDENYLIQNDDRFVILNDLSDSSPSALNAEDMDDFIAELNLLSNQIEEAESLEHLEKIKILAQKCKELKGSHLVLTPFSIR
ncbi:hypothetical protein [Saccharibacillus endophyticus]|uniref:Uncharacterized protein n=1 Tax=Saccharibacillus endophyticus TaxID=2060666 RepID=A0ABQ2A082_9BACL|nr:hypothetical protein [Saccharibacillus endophyticus]GGH82611.1 hypothetical protein GCM10007362_34190 [Saccharibacillus endophyticus]